MKRIFASLFAILTIVSVGVFATGAFFTDTITQSNYNFTTGSADLKFAPCPALNADCSAVVPTLDNYNFVTSELTGPGMSNSGCLVIKNTGQYALSLSTQLFVTNYSDPDMAHFFEVATDNANQYCQVTSPQIPWARAENQAAAGDVATGITLAPGAKAYAIVYNQWDSAGNQNYLQNGFLTLKSVITGTTV